MLLPECSLQARCMKADVRCDRLFRYDQRQAAVVDISYLYPLPIFGGQGVLDGTLKLLDTPEFLCELWRQELVKMFHGGNVTGYSLG